MKPSTKEVLLMAMFQSLQLVSARLASALAYQLWFHPGRRSHKQIPDFNPAGLQSHGFKLHSKSIRYWSAGSGPTVLLMHGWASCGKHMQHLARALLAQQYRVLWLDAPAHGLSSGWQTNLYEISDCLLKIQQAEGKLAAIIGHSFGVVCSLYAINHGLQSCKLIGISPPAETQSLIDKFCSMIRASEQTQRHLTRRIEKFIQQEEKQGGITDIDAKHLARNIQQPCLIIHDKQDRMVAYQQGQTLAQSLSHAHFILTRKLGHNKILQAPETLQHCIDFIGGKAPQDKTISLAS